MNLRIIAKTILKKLGLFEKTKSYIKNIEKKKRLKGKYKFENRMKNKEKVCIILSGYKEFLWDIVFKRIKTFIPDDIEVCILSSGKYCEKLSNIAKENDWSYLSTKRNNISLIQNIAINLFKNAKYIYKLDEDIFVTDGYFETLMKTYIDCEKNGEYEPGFIAPIIPINGFGHMAVLKRFGLMETYTKLFEKPKYTLGKMIVKNPEVAKFLWGEGNYLPNIDTMNDIVKKDDFSYQICPIRFSIGAILFKRELWDNMGYFKVTKEIDLGIDEKQICECCITLGRAIIVSNNTIVGHLSFGQQNASMKEYFMNHKDVFDIKN